MGGLRVSDAAKAAAACRQTQGRRASGPGRDGSTRGWKRCVDDKRRARTRSVADMTDESRRARGWRRGPRRRRMQTDEASAARSTGSRQQVRAAAHGAAAANVGYRPQVLVDGPRRHDARRHPRKGVGWPAAWAVPELEAGERRPAQLDNPTRPVRCGTAWRVPPASSGCRWAAAAAQRAYLRVQRRAGDSSQVLLGSQRAAPAPTTGSCTAALRRL